MALISQKAIHFKQRAEESMEYSFKIELTVLSGLVICISGVFKKVVQYRKFINGCSILACQNIMKSGLWSVAKRIIKTELEVKPCIKSEYARQDCKYYLSNKEITIQCNLIEFSIQYYFLRSSVHVLLLFSYLNSCDYTRSLRNYLSIMSQAPINS